MHLPAHPERPGLIPDTLDCLVSLNNIVNRLGDAHIKHIDIPAIPESGSNQRAGYYRRHGNIDQLGLAMVEPG